jgi:erythromycin esterase-like protein
MEVVGWKERRRRRFHTFRGEINQPDSSGEFQHLMQMKNVLFAMKLIFLFMKNEASREENMTEQKNNSTNLRASGVSENCEWVLMQLIKREKVINYC